MTDREKLLIEFAERALATNKELDGRLFTNPLYSSFPAARAALNAIIAFDSQPRFAIHNYRSTAGARFYIDKHTGKMHDIGAVSEAQLAAIVASLNTGIIPPPTS